jgi:hypothetical protein
MVKRSTVAALPLKVEVHACTVAVHQVDQQDVKRF